MFANLISSLFHPIVLLQLLGVEVPCRWLKLQYRKLSFVFEPRETRPYLSGCLKEGTAFFIRQSAPISSARFDSVSRLYLPTNTYLHTTVSYVDNVGNSQSDPRIDRRRPRQPEGGAMPTAVEREQCQRPQPQHHQRRPAMDKSVGTHP